MKEAKIYKELKLDDTESGKLEFAIILEPYGEGSKPVVSIESKLEAQSWKVHIPLSQLKAARKALKEAKAAYKKYSKDSKKSKKEAKADAKKAPAKKDSKKEVESCTDKKCKKDKKQDATKN